MVFFFQFWTTSLNKRGQAVRNCEYCHFLRNFQFRNIETRAQTWMPKIAAIENVLRYRDAGGTLRYRDGGELIRNNATLENLPRRWG